MRLVRKRRSSVTEATCYFAFNDQTERYRRTVGEETEGKEMESEESAAQFRVTPPLIVQGR